MAAREFSALLSFFTTGRSAMAALALPWGDLNACSDLWPTAPQSEPNGALEIPGVHLLEPRAVARAGGARGGGL